MKAGIKRIAPQPLRWLPLARKSGTYPDRNRQTHEVQAWLREVERFRDAHTEALEPKASRDERANARLIAIGPYELSYDSEAPSSG
jgi:hypothetical protein